jgi:hypothetical protein
VDAIEHGDLQSKNSSKVESLFATLLALNEVRKHGRDGMQYPHAASALRDVPAGERKKGVKSAAARAVASRRVGEDIAMNSSPGRYA